jgi:hypothetical protein
MPHDPAKLLCDLEHRRDAMTEFMASPSAKGQAATGFMLQHHAEVSIILSKLSELQAQKVVKQTNHLIVLTWILAVLTLAMLWLCVVQTKIVVKQDAEAAAQHLESSQNR